MSMADDHKRDYESKRLYDEAVRALEAVIADDAASRRLGKRAVPLIAAIRGLHEASEQVVRTWN